MNRNSLVDSVNSMYVNACNSLRPQNSKIEIVVYVEDYDDIPFWYSMFEKVNKGNYQINFYPPSREKLHRGKIAVLNITDQNRLGEYLILCVDSDLDYLLNKKTETSIKLLTNPYIFHTYLYSTENFKCQKEFLKDYLITCTQNVDVKFDFDTFFTNYSYITYECFIVLIYCYSISNTTTYTISDFCSDVIIEEFNDNSEIVLEKIRNKISTRIKSLSYFISVNKVELDLLQVELNTLGFTKEITYLFIQGHTVLNNVVMMLLKPMSRNLKKENETQIKLASVDNADVKVERLRQYRNQLGLNKGCNIEDRINRIVVDNYDYKNCYFSNKIIFDITKYLNSINKSVSTV